MVQAVSAAGVASCSVGTGCSGAGFAEHADAEVAAGFGQFVMLFGEHGADEGDQGVAVGEDSDDVGAPLDLSVEALDRYL